MIGSNKAYFQLVSKIPDDLLGSIPYTFIPFPQKVEPWQSLDVALGHSMGAMCAPDHTADIGRGHTVLLGT